MSDFDAEPYAEGIRELNRLEAERIGHRLEIAKAEALRLAEAIAAADPAVRRILLFGSVASGKPSGEGFDIDLAIDGGDLYAAMDIVEGSEFEIDLVDLSRLPASMRRIVEVRGQTLVGPIANRFGL